MKKFELTFNPYTKESRIVIGGKPEKKRKEAICGRDGTDLFLWAGDFFPRAVDSFNDAVEVTFNGIERDYEFLEDALKAFPEKGSQLKPGTISKPEDRLQKLRDLFAKMQEESPFAVLKSAEQRELFTEATDSTYEMAAVATMSAGKSTLINSMLGREILPARQEATTARVARIHDVAGKNVYSAEAYDGNHKLLEQIEPLDLEAMNRLNDMAEALQVDIWGAIPGIESKDVSLILADTPGPNNSQSAEHQKHTYDLLNSEWKPMILYVLNSTALGTNDDAYLLDKVASIMQSGDRQSHDRFLFVLNKAEEFDPGKGESVARKLDDVKEYLQQHGIHHPRIMPTSARLAKLIRQDRNGDALTSREKKILILDTDDFIEDTKKHFTDYARFLSPATDAALKARVEKAKAANDESELALLYSGVPSVEMAISEYLMKYAVPDKIARGVETFKGKIDSLKIEADAKKAIEDDKGKIAELQKALERLQAVLEKGDMAKKVRAQISALSVEKETRKLLVEVCERLNRDVLRATSEFQGEMTVQVAKLKLKDLIARVNAIQADFVSRTEIVIGHLLQEQADKCMEQYNQYIRDIMGAAKFTMPADLVLPRDISSDDPSSVPVDYIEQRNVKTGTRTRTKENLEASTFFKGQSSWRARFARRMGWNSFMGKPAYVTYEEDIYEKRDYFNFDKYIVNSLQPKIAKFVIATQTTAIKDASKEAEAFKAQFIKHLEKLDAAIQLKAKELQRTLADKEKLRKELDQNEKNLKWLRAFIAELDCVLKI